MKTDFSQIIFDPANHTYTYQGRPLTGATRRLAQLKRPFDSDYWAKRKAKEQGVSVETILKQWDDDRRRNMQRGEQIHTYIAQILRAEMGQAEAVSPPVLTRIAEVDSFNHFWQETCTGNYTRIHQVEWVIGDVELGLAGTADAIFYNQETGLHHLWDWKTGGKFKTDNRFQTLLHPFADFDDCEITNYSLQLSLYRLFIERNTDLVLGDSYLLYLPSYGGHAVYTAIDFREPLRKWLTASEANNAA